MIKEAYCSYEVSKLLKEKGMDKEYFTHYIQKNNTDGTSEAVTTCTHQMAMKWLREAHNLHCDVGYDDLDWFWNIISVDDTVPVEDRPKLLKDGTAGHKTYEEAVEEALKYALENLI